MLKDRFRTTLHFVRQDLLERYRNDFLGVAWLVIQPLILIVLFSVVFSSLMRARLPGLDPTFGYTVYLITGILAWNAFAQTLSRLSGWYRDRAGLYRKLALGLYAPAFSVVVSEFLIYVVAMALFAGFLLLVGHPLTWQWLWLPLLAGCFLAMAFGLGLCLGLLEVFIPDIRRAMPLVLQLGFWLTPIVYTLDILPVQVRSLVQLSPITLALQPIQKVVVFGEPPGYGQLLGLLLTAFVSLLALVWLGQRLKKVVRDAL
jgi:lipopolysaccharide transport system permease protein